MLDQRPLLCKSGCHGHDIISVTCVFCHGFCVFTIIAGSLVGHQITRHAYLRGHFQLSPPNTHHTLPQPLQRRCLCSFLKVHRKN